ncbi:MAG: T9SS type A sorting domain-containing protein, partial [Bacteroidales bacterium]|nr:T9SS type A sorting domain-containing protein [Candidatus Scybalocola fimicaballi]
TGQYRYYDGLVHYLAMLHLTGSFKIWKATPSDIKEESAKGEYNGVKYTEDAVVYDFKDCELIKVSVAGVPTDVENVESEEITIVPNPASTKIQIVADEEIKMVELIDMIGNKVISTNDTVINVSALQNGIYMAVISTENAQIVKKVMIKK